MQASTLNELQKELITLPSKQLVELCIRLAKYKKDNKELLTYLLFEANDEEAFISSIKTEVDEQFIAINSSNLYLAKKSIRKILRMINKFVRYSQIKQTDLELRIYYCRKLKDSGIAIEKSPVLMNLYNNQLKKIEATLSKLHEDLQYDYKKELESLM